MMIPIRCFSCGQVIADKWEEFNTKVNSQKADSDSTMTSLGVNRYCCRRMLASHIDLIDEVINYSRK